VSLVNDMLNDLDERRSKQTDSSASLKWLTGRAPIKSEKKYMPLIAIFFILLLAVIGFYIWEYQLNSSSGAADKLLDKTSYLPDDNRSSDSSSLTKTLSAMRVDVPVRAAPVPGQLIKHEKPRSNDITEDEEREVAAKIVGKSERKSEIVKNRENVSDIQSESKIEKIDRDNMVAPSVAPPLKKNEPIKKAQAIDARFVKTSRPLTPEQLDRKAAKKASSLLKTNDLHAAEKTLEKFMEDHPAALNSGQLLASIWLSQKKFLAAGELIDTLRSGRPRHAGLLVSYARLLLLTERGKDAVKLLLSERPQFESHLAYYELLALAARQDQQYQLSEQTYRALVSADAGRGDWWFGLAIALDAQGLQNKASRAFLSALKLNDLSAGLADYARQRLLASSGNDG